MDRAEFFAHLRKKDSGVFGTSLSQGQVDGINEILAAIGALPVTHAAYILATAYHETGRTMQPVREAHGKSTEQTIARLDAWARKIGRTSNIYWRKDADGKAWFGRGYVQLTWKRNYEKAAAITGVDLVGNPDLAMRADVAAKVLVEGSKLGIFTGKKLSDYLPADYINARRVINGTDRARDIAGYAVAFENALRAAGYTVTKQKPATAPQEAPTAGYTPDGLGGLLTAILRALASIFGKRKDQ